MTTDQLKRYREIRASHAFLPASRALEWAKALDYSELWEESTRHDGRWTREVEGFEIVLRVEDESIFPNPDQHGSTDYGRYVDEVSRYSGLDEWDGNWSPPAESAPLGLPYTAIRYSGPRWVQGDMSGGYFIPDGIEDTYASFRRQGQSKSVAWDLTRADVEERLKMLFCSPLTYCTVVVEAWRADVELASTAMGTDVSGDDDGRAYIFAMVEEHDMLAEVIEEAGAKLSELSVDVA